MTQSVLADAAKQNPTKMLAAPKDGKVKFFKAESDKKPAKTLNAPLSVYVNEQNFNNAIRKGASTKLLVDQVKDHPECNGLYTRISNIRNTTSASKALNFFGINDDTERAAFMGKAEFESSDARPEGMKYSYKRWLAINSQIKSYCRAYQKEHHLTEEQMSAWSDSLSDKERANIMYGYEGYKYAAAHGEKPSGSKWIGEQLGNTHENDGYQFRGRSFLQLTGRGHWQKIQDQGFKKDSTGWSPWERYIGKQDPVNIMQNPDILDNNVRMGYFVSACFWKHTNKPRIEKTLAANHNKYKGAKSLKEVEERCSNKDVMEIAALSNSGNYTDTNWLYLGDREKRSKSMIENYEKYNAAYKAALSTKSNTPNSNLTIPDKYKNYVPNEQNNENTITKSRYR